MLRTSIDKDNWYLNWSPIGIQIGSKLVFGKMANRYPKWYSNRYLNWLKALFEKRTTYPLDRYDSIPAVILSAE